MAAVKVTNIQLTGQPKTLFAVLKNDINLNVNGTTKINLRLTDKGNDNYEIELIPLA